MWPSSRSPDFGFIGTAAIPAMSAPTIATQVSGRNSAHIAIRLAAATSCATCAAAARSAG
jgi:hypothetical protein